MAAPGAAILRIGMTTAVGLGARQTGASVRAGIARFSESSLHDRRFQPYVLAALSEEMLSPLHADINARGGLRGREIRMLRLAAPALAEVLKGLPDSSRIPLLLATSEPLGDQTNPIREGFLAHLATQTGETFDVRKSRLFPQGRAAAFLALKEGLQRIDSREAKAVIVGGVDTYVDPYVLGILDLEGRVLAEGVKEGFRPGEGACFLLLGSPVGTGVVKSPPLAQIPCVGTGQEKGHRYSDEVYRGDGLALAFHNLFTSMPAAKEKVRVVFAGLNGEHFFAKEWGTAFLRHKSQFTEDIRIEHPADCFGDPGAALAPLMLGLAAIGVKRNLLQGPCLVWASSDHEERGAAIVQRFAA